MSIGILLLLLVVIAGAVGLIAVATIATILVIHRRGKHTGDEIDSSRQPG